MSKCRIHNGTSNTELEIIWKLLATSCVATRFKTTRFLLFSSSFDFIWLCDFAKLETRFGHAGIRFFEVSSALPRGPTVLPEIGAPRGLSGAWEWRHLDPGGGKVGKLSVSCPRALPANVNTVVSSACHREAQPVRLWTCRIGSNKGRSQQDRVPSDATWLMLQPIWRQVFEAPALNVARILSSSLLDLAQKTCWK